MHVLSLLLGETDVICISSNRKFDETLSIFLFVVLEFRVFPLLLQELLYMSGPCLN